MLNLYKYYDDAKSLPMYNDMTELFPLLQKWYEWEPTDIEELEPVLHIIARSSKLSFYYACNVIQGRWTGGENAVKRTPEFAYHYAVSILAEDPEWPHANGRWPEAEPVIMKSGFEACMYAVYILKHRWPEAEPYISKSNWWQEYKDKFKV